MLGTWHADADQDGYGDPGSAYDICDPPPGYVGNSEDCDDKDATAFPGGKEVCDGADNDCDGDTDEEVTTTYYRDADGDGFGLLDTSTEACSTPTGFAAVPGDCDDSDGTVSPNATELCDRSDNDCDGSIDEDDAVDALTWHADVDTNGYGDADATTTACAQPSGYVANSEDCDDSSDAISPDSAEVCNSIDDDCDGAIDDDDSSVSDRGAWYIDYDGDGYGSARYSLDRCTQPTGYVENTEDCDDTDSAISPDAAEVCNGIDDDCDGDTDDDDGDLDDATKAIWYADTDTDGFGDPGESTRACRAPEGYTDNAEDCDDEDADASPNALEYCDGHEDDCDGETDEDDAVDVAEWYLDSDGDGYGDRDSATVSCDPPSGTVASDEDCDDSEEHLVYSCDLLGDGSDGSLSVSGTHNLNTDASGSRSWPDGIAWQVTDTVSRATLTLEATDGLAAGDLILLAALQGSSEDVGAWEVLQIDSVGSGSLTLSEAPSQTYGAHDADDIFVQRIPQYEDLTISGTLTASAWDKLSSGSTTGRATGVVAVKVAGGLEVSGSIDISALGYPGGRGGGPDGPWGETTDGGGTGGSGGWADGGDGAGTATGVSGGSGAASCSSSGGSAGLGGGGGGGKITHCAGGVPVTGGWGGGGGAPYNAQSNETDDVLTWLHLGGGGAAGAGGGESGANAGSGTTTAPGGGPADGGDGGAGGGIALLWAHTTTLTGAINLEGSTGGVGGTGESTDGGGSDDGSGGGGAGGQGAAGGTALLMSLYLDASPSSILAWGGNGGDGGSGGSGYPGRGGGAGGSGAAPGDSPTSGGTGIYAGDGGASAGGGAGGEGGASGVIHVSAVEVNGAAFGSTTAASALDDATEGLLSNFSEWAP